MNNIEKLLKSLSEEIMKEVEEMEEVSTSAAAGGYLTPHAFGKKKKKGMTNVAGYRLHPSVDDDEGIDLNENTDNRSLSPAQQIGQSISEINKQINVIEQVVNRSVKLKNESHMGSQHLWKRTAKTLAKLESKILRVAKQIRELKG